MRLFQTTLLLKNEESIDNKSIKGSKHLRIAMESLRRRCLLLTCKWNPSKGVWHPSEGGTLYLCITCNGFPLEEFGVSQKEVHFIMYNLLIESFKRRLASFRKS